MKSIPPVCALLRGAGTSEASYCRAAVREPRSVHDGLRIDVASWGSAIDVAIPAGRAVGVVRETARLLAAERLRAPDEAGVLAFPVREFAFGRSDTWFRVDRG